MGRLTERITPDWVVQLYAGIKALVDLLFLASVPFEVRAGHPFRHSPFNDVPGTGWRIGQRAAALWAWLAVFLWAGGKIWSATTRPPAAPPSS